MKSLLLLIEEFESIVNTIYTFESIALLEAGNKLPPIEIPTYAEERNRTPGRFGSKAGRKYDASAPQKPIEEKVQELANLDKFQDKKGKPKPTSIRDEIVTNYPELMGDIQERALFDRVKKALSTLFTDENGNYINTPF